MSANGNREFIHQGSQGEFDRHARILAERQSAAGLLALDLDPGNLASWTEIPPTPVAALPASIETTADHEIASEARRDSWKRLVPEGVPTLLLTGPKTDSAADVLALAVRAAVPERDLTHPVSAGTVDTRAVRSWLAARQRGDRPVAIVATSDLVRWLFGFLERRRLRFRLPTGSQLLTAGIATGASQVRSSVLPVTEHFGLPVTSVLHQIGFPTLTTPLGIRPTAGGSLVLAPPPLWVRYRPSSRPSGRLVVADLATTNLPFCQLTDLRVSAGDGILVVQS